MSRVAISSALALFIAACASTASPPPETPETRCQRICKPESGSPCQGQSDPSCTSSCLARLSGKSDTCASCLHAQSGWKGTTCSCDDAFGGFGSASCETCHWLGAGKSCSGAVGNSCSVAQGCEGLVIAPIGDPSCASTCGETPIVDAGTE